MKNVEVFDKPMCCSTGVCGPKVDPVLPRFAADLAWLKAQGVPIERFNLAQQPTAFIQNAAVHELLTSEGIECLPLIVVDGRVVSQRGYPSREMLTLWTEAGRTQEPLPKVKAVGGCCSGSACC